MCIYLWINNVYHSNNVSSWNNVKQTEDVHLNVTTQKWLLTVALKLSLVNIND